MSQLQLENAVLRHQVKVLRRSVRRPELKDRDRAFLAAASRVLSRDQTSPRRPRPAGPPGHPDTRGSSSARLRA
jgi:hypothetical protein